jgi:hypothetical protein
MGKRKPGLNAIQYDLLITAILKHTSLVSERRDKRTIAACQRHGWLSAEPVVTDADGAWFFLLKAGLDAVLTYHSLHIYDPVDDNIGMHYAWQIHVNQHKLCELGLVEWKDWYAQVELGWDERIF